MDARNTPLFKLAPWSPPLASSTSPLLPVRPVGDWDAPRDPKEEKKDSQPPPSDLFALDCSLGRGEGGPRRLGSNLVPVVGAGLDGPLKYFSLPVMEGEKAGGEGGLPAEGWGKDTSMTRSTGREGEEEMWGGSMA